MGQLTINLLEFLAAAVTISLALSKGGVNQKVLAYTDSSSVLGWLHKTSFSEKQEGHDKVARWLTRHFLEKESSLYSQHIKGKANLIADMLSRDHHLSEIQLTFLFRTILPKQTPKNFAIYPLTEERTFWIYSLCRSSTKEQESPAQHCKSRLGALIDGDDSCRQMESKTSGCLAFAKSSAPESSPHSPELAEEIFLARQIDLSYEAQPLKPPCHMYVRPSVQTYSQIPH